MNKTQFTVNMLVTINITQHIFIVEALEESIKLFQELCLMCLLNTFISNRDMYLTIKVIKGSGFAYDIASNLYILSITSSNVVWYLS